MAPAINLSHKFDPKYADLHIEIDGKTFHVHRAVVCGASQVMAMAADGAFMENDIRVIEQSYFDADVMDKMLQFMYRGEYTFDPADTMATITSEEDAVTMALGALTFGDNTSSEGMKRLATHVDVYAIARHYELPDLEQLAVSKFSLERQTQESLSADDLLDIAEAVYNVPSSFPSNLQQQVLSVALANAPQYLSQSVFRAAILERTNLRTFSESFLAGIITSHKAELAGVVQDSQIEIEKLQDKMSNEKQNLTQELLSKKLAYEHAHEQAGKWHKYAKRLSSEKTKMDAELQASHEKMFQEHKEHVSEVQRRNDKTNTLETDLKLAREKITRLESKHKFDQTRADIKNSLEATRAIKDKLDIDARAELQDALEVTRAVNDQLLDLNCINHCRHRPCGAQFYYNFERYGPNGYLARCVWCRTRHFSGPNNGFI